MKFTKDAEGRSVKILGRAGIVYKDSTGEYLVDSEMLDSSDVNYVIYADNIR